MQSALPACPGQSTVVCTVACWREGEAAAFTSHSSREPGHDSPGPSVQGPRAGLFLKNLSGVMVC